MEGTSFIEDSEDIEDINEVIAEVSEDLENEREGRQLLVPRSTYTGEGVHIGTVVVTQPMKPYVYLRRDDTVNILDVERADERIRIAAKFLSKYDPNEVALFSSRIYGTVPVTVMARTTGFQVRPGRFVPGTLTNPLFEEHVEPKVIMVVDPRTDKQALKEAGAMGITVVALCDTDSLINNVDLLIPVNNKGMKSLALVCYLLSQEILKNRGEIPQNKTLVEAIDVPLNEFRYDRGAEDEESDYEEIIEEEIIEEALNEGADTPSTE